MKSPWPSKLLKVALRQAWSASIVARRGQRRPARPLLVEQLEERCLLSQGLQAISLSSTGQASGESYYASISANGQEMVFTSSGTAVIAGQNQDPNNTAQNIFLYNQQTNTTVLVNHLPGAANSTGDNGVGATPGDGSDPLPSFLVPQISADGSSIAFASYDDNLVANETLPAGAASGSVMSVYRYSVQTGLITLLNHAKGNAAAISGNAWDPVISQDGSAVAFTMGDTASSASTLVVSSLNGSSQTFTTPNGSYQNLVISGNGKLIAYNGQSADGEPNVFLLNLGGANPTTTLVSHASNSSTTEANGPSSSVVLSQDGSTLAFVSTATNLVKNQSTSGSSGLTNVFWYNVGNNTVGLVSGTGGVTANNNSDSPAIDANGVLIAYRSSASNLVNNQSGSNIYEFTIHSQSQTLVSHAAGNPQIAASDLNGAPNDCSAPLIDSDGTVVEYVSSAVNLVGNQSNNNGLTQVFAWLQKTNANFLVSGQAGSPTQSGNGPSASPVLAANGMPGFSSAAGLLPNTAGTSVAYVSTVGGGAVSLSSNTIPDGKTAGYTIGTMTYSFSFAGQFISPSWSFATAAGATSFSLGSSDGITSTLITNFMASYTVQSTYQVDILVNIGFGPLDFPQTVVVTPSVPVAANQSYTATAGITLTTPAPGLFLNDSVEATPPTIVLPAGSQPAHGAFSVNATSGALLYTPNANYTGPDSFTYQIKDADGDLSNVATVSLTVVAPPAAANHSYTATAGNTLSIAAPGLFAGDSGGFAPLTIVLPNGSQPAHGPFSVNATTGVLLYTPTANYSGSDSFTYQIKDANGSLSNVATVSFTDVPPPTAANQNYTATAGTTLTAPAPGLFANDSGGAAPLTVVLPAGSQPAHGPFAVNAATGVLLYTPAANYVGPDSFTYEIEDANGILSNVATVSFTVVPPPTVQSASYTTGPTGLTVNAPGVLMNATGGFGTLIPIFGNPAHGQLTTGTNGSFTYVPTTGYSGPDSFTFQAKDANGALSNTGTISFTDLAPLVANADTYTAILNTTLTVAAPGVLANDTGGDAPLQAMKVTGPTHGSLTLNADGSFTYTPATGYTGPDSFTYQDKDALGTLSSVVTDTITVQSAGLTLTPGTVLEFRPPATPVGTIAVTGNGTGHTYTYTLVSGAGFTISGTQLLTTDSFDAGATPTLPVQIKATDELGGTISQTLTVTVLADPNIKRTGQTLTITGSQGNDTFTFGAGSPQYMLTLDGVKLAVDTSMVNTIVFQGGGGSASATLTAGAGTNSATISPDSGTLNGPGYSVVVSKTSNIVVVGGSAGNNAYAYLYSSPGGDFFTGTPAWSVLSGPGFDNEAAGFQLVEAVSSAGGPDNAVLYDAAGTNTFYGTATQTYLYGSGYFVEAFGFKTAVASRVATGSTDVAYVFDSGGSNTFVGTPTYGYLLSGSGSFFNEAAGFQAVYGIAAANSSDTAQLFDSGGTNLFTANPEFAILQGSTFLLEVVSFHDVAAMAGAGSKDTANLFGLGGSDTFDGGYTQSTLSGTGFANAAVGFALVGVSESSGSANAVLIDSPGNDIFTGFGSTASLSSQSPDYSISLGNFGTVTAISQKGGQDLLNVQTVDYAFSAPGNWLNPVF